MELVKIYNNFEDSPLYNILGGSSEALKRYFIKNPSEIDKLQLYYHNHEKCSTGDYGFSVLSYVVDSENYELIPILLSYGANPNQYDVCQNIDDYDYNNSVHSSIIYHLVHTHIKHSDKVMLLADFMRMVKNHSKFKFDVDHLNRTLKYVLGQLEESVNAKLFAETLLHHGAKADMFIEQQMFLLEQSSCVGSLCYSEENNQVFQKCLNDAVEFLWNYAEYNIKDLCMNLERLNVKVEETFLILSEFVPNIPDKKAKILKLIVNIKCDRLDELIFKTTISR